MNMSPRLQVEKQVRKVRRRLMMHQLVQGVFVAWAIALVVSAVWFVGQSLFYPACPSELRWALPGTLVGLGTLAAVARAWSRRPSLEAAALALDDRCELRERVTTYLTLPAEMQERAAAQALADDVHTQVAKLNLAGKFPMPLTWG